MKFAKDIGFSVRNGVGPFLIHGHHRRNIAASVKPKSIAQEDEVTLKWNEFYVNVNVLELSSDDQSSIIGKIIKISPYTTEILPFELLEDIEFSEEHVISRTLDSDNLSGLSTI